MATRRLSEAVDAYLADLVLRRMSPQTIPARRSCLTAFAASAGPGQYVSQIGAGHVREFFYGTPGCPGIAARIAPTTHNKYRNVIGYFFHYCMSNGWTRRTRDELLSHVRVLDEDTDRERSRLSLERLYEVVDAAGNPRDRALLATTTSICIRGGELTRIMVHEYDGPGRRLIKTVTKRNGPPKKTWEDIPPYLVAELDQWLGVYAEAMSMAVTELVSQSDFYLFPRLTRHGIHAATHVLHPRLPMGKPYRITRKALDEIGITDAEMGNPTPLPSGRRHARGVHVGRRSVARVLLDESGDIRVAQAALGHKKQATTEIYVGHKEDRVKLAGIMQTDWRRPPAGGTVVPFRLRREGERA